MKTWGSWLYQKVVKAFVLVSYANFKTGRWTILSLRNRGQCAWNNASIKMQGWDGLSYFCWMAVTALHFQPFRTKLHMYTLYGKSKFSEVDSKTKGRADWHLNLTSIFPGMVDPPCAPLHAFLSNELSRRPVPDEMTMWLTWCWIRCRQTHVKGQEPGQPQKKLFLTFCSRRCLYYPTEKRQQWHPVHE